MATATTFCFRSATSTSTVYHRTSAVLPSSDQTKALQPSLFAPDQLLETPLIQIFFLRDFNILRIINGNMAINLEC